MSTIIRNYPRTVNPTNLTLHCRRSNHCEWLPQLWFECCWNRRFTLSALLAVELDSWNPSHNRHTLRFCVKALTGLRACLMVWLISQVSMHSRMDILRGIGFLVSLQMALLSELSNQGIKETCAQCWDLQYNSMCAMFTVLCLHRWDPACCLPCRNHLAGGPLFKLDIHARASTMCWNILLKEPMKRMRITASWLAFCGETILAATVSTYSASGYPLSVLWANSPPKSFWNKDKIWIWWTRQI